jgi:hypothetical protein
MNDYMELITPLKLMTKNNMKMIEDNCIKYLEQDNFKCLCKYISVSALSPRLIHYIINRCNKLCGCCLYKTRIDKLCKYLDKLEYSQLTSLYDLYNPNTDKKIIMNIIKNHSNMISYIQIKKIILLNNTIDFDDTTINNFFKPLHI